MPKQSSCCSNHLSSSLAAWPALIWKAPGNVATLLLFTCLLVQEFSSGSRCSWLTFIRIVRPHAPSNESSPRYLRPNTFSRRCRLLNQMPQTCLQWFYHYIFRIQTMPTLYLDRCFSQVNQKLYICEANYIGKPWNIRFLSCFPFRRKFQETLLDKAVELI